MRCVEFGISSPPGNKARAEISTSHPDSSRADFAKNINAEPIRPDIQHIQNKNIQNEQ